MPGAKTPSESLQLQDRDIALFRGLFECRVMTPAHIAALYFDGKREYTKKRLQKLKAAGFVGERKRRVNEPSVLFLTRKGFVFLGRQGHLDAYPSLTANSFDARAKVGELTLRHELEVMDVKAAFHAALAASDTFTLLEFSTWPLLHEFRITRPDDGKEVPVRPDGFIRIHETERGTKGSIYDCFLEVDRSSEVQDTLLTKAACYLDYFKSGGFAERNGGSRLEPREFPFRVLMVFKSVERRNNTAERLLLNTPAILRMTWLTTLTEATKEPLGSIWIRPSEYREVTAGTPFDPVRTIPSGEYRRQPGRDAFIESKIKKLHFRENQATGFPPANPASDREASTNDTKSSS